MPRKLGLFIAIPFLDFADKLLVVPSDLLQVIIGKLAPLLFQFAFELRPFPLELISVHRTFLLCTVLIPQLHVSVRSSRRKTVEYSGIPRSHNPRGASREHMDRDENDSDQEQNPGNLDR